MAKTNYSNAMFDIRDMIWEDICEANTIERKTVETIANKYNVTITDEDYETLKEEWEEG